MSVMAPPMPQQAIPQQGRPPIPQPAPGVGNMQQPAQKPLLTPDEFRKLKDKVKNSYAALEPERQARKAALTQYVAQSLGARKDDPAAEATLVNMLDQMVEVYMQKLVSGNPQCIILTQKLALKTAARYFQLALNHVIHQIDLRESLAFAVLESMFSMAIVKTGVDHPSVSRRSYPFDVSAVPWAEAVFFDDWVHDTNAKRLELMSFCGDRYTELKEAVKNDPRNDKSAMESLNSDGGNALDQGGPPDEDGKGGVFEEGEKETVMLWDIWVPHKRILVTYIDNDPEKPLRVVKWNGPPNGPYRIGRYKLVPNKIMPKPPVQDILPLADLENKIWNKMGEQACRQKTVAFAPLGAKHSADAIIRANDGEVINVTHGDQVRQAKWGGVEQENLVFSQAVKQRASYEGGNLDTMGGLGTQAGTLGQEELLSQSSSDRITARQMVIVELTKGVMYDIGWYLWNDPLVRISVTDKIPQTDIQVDVKWPVQSDGMGGEQDMRQGEYNDFNFDIEPYSMQSVAPGARAQKIMGLLTTLLLPAEGQLQAQGIAIDFEALIEKLSVYMGIPELMDILTFANGPPGDTQAVNTGGSKPPQTTRTYDRVVKPKGPDDSAGAAIASLGSGGGSGSAGVPSVPSL